VDIAYNTVSSNLYIIDRLRDKVLIFATDGMFADEFGHSTGNGHFSTPECLAIDSSGNVYVGSYYSYSLGAGFYFIQKFDKDGNWITGFGGSTFGTGDGELGEGAADIAVGPSDEIFVCDHGNDRIQVFNSYGTYLRQWAAASPYGIDVYPVGKVLVKSDTLESILAFSSD
jgi:DNA-binding beta-propeller fold protein YncE